jgi:hypothetical protein
MSGITIRWREEPFACEFRGGTAGGSLYLFENDELVATDTVATLVVAHQRARELSSALLWKRAKGA